MSLLDALIHIANFIAPALGLGVVAASFVKLFWWRSLRSVSWISLAAVVMLACAVVLVLGLLLLGRDGKMLTYAFMVLASAVALWWAGLRRV